MKPNLELPSDLAGMLPEGDPADMAQPHGGLSAGWSVPWSDLMMVMFILFVVLFVYVSTHRDVRIVFRDRGGGEITSPVDSLEGLIGHFAGSMENRAVEGYTVIGGPEVFYKSEATGVSVVRESGGRLRIVLRGDTFFAPGETGLVPESGQYLREISELLRLANGAVHVIGFASQTEADSMTGFALSTNRAAAVAAYLIEGLGVEADRFTVSGRSIYEPEVPATSRNHEQTNRRVEIVVHTGAQGPSAP